MVCTRSCPKYLVAFNSSYFGKYCKKPLVGKCATSKVLHFRASRVGKIILNGTQGTHTSPERNLVRYPSSQNFLFELHEIFLVKLKDFPRASFSVSNLHSLSLVDKNWQDIFCRAGVSVSSRNVVNGTLPPQLNVMFLSITGMDMEHFVEFPFHTAGWGETMRSKDFLSHYGNKTTVEIRTQITIFQTITSHGFLARLAKTCEPRGV